MLAPDPGLDRWQSLERTPLAMNGHFVHVEPAGFREDEKAIASARRRWAAIGNKGSERKTTSLGECIDRDPLLFRVSLIWLAVVAAGCAYMMLQLL
jgi:hypothetical protein